MKNTLVNKSVLLAVLVTACGPAAAASWQDRLSSAANQLTSQSGTTASHQSLPLNSLTGLLNGNSQSLSASTINNAAGVLQYCIQQKLVSAPNAFGIKDKLLSKLNLNHPQQQSRDSQQDYTQGLSGMLNTGQGRQINLKTLGDSPLAQKVKNRACDLVLKQGSNFLL